jgi:hypothetical protein
MNDATLTWTKSLTGTPTSYSVIWTQNGTALPAVSTPASAGADTSGYSQDFATANPTVTVNPGDVIGATVQAIDATNSLSSAVTPSVPANVTIPATPVAPGIPQNVVLALS